MPYSYQIKSDVRNRAHLVRYGLFVLVLLNAPAWGAAPIFENATPVGFALHDSTTQADFVVGDTVRVRADLNQAVNTVYPVTGHFHALEQSDQVGTTATDGMQVDVAIEAVAPFGVERSNPAIHMAWIEEVGVSAGLVYSGGITPVYQVKYARSVDRGATFTAPISISGTITYHPLSTNGNGVSFSTVDLEIDSHGQPRVAYAFVSTASRARNRNVYFTYSQDEGSTWQTPVRVNNLSQAEGQTCAFPRLVVDDRDNLFIGYVRGTTTGGSTDDVMLAKVNRTTSPFTMMPIGEAGTAGSGGVRLTPDTERHTGPDLSLGDSDALHIIYFNDTDNRIEHRRVSTDTAWVDVSAAGWNQDVDGASVASFDNAAATNAALEKNAVFYFPTIAVDRQRLPDRAYAVYKFGDNTPVEGIYFNQYDDSGTVGTGITWGSSASVWNAGLFADGNQAYNVELDWELTERVAAVVDSRPVERGDLHIAFSAGYSSSAEHDLYYARYNGGSWTLPEKVADDDSDSTFTHDGIANADVFLLSPSLAQHPGSDNIYLGFAGGIAEGLGIDGVTDVNHHAYFKVLGRAVSAEDQSVPVGGFQYDLTYVPVNPQTAVAEITDNPVYVHAADPGNGAGLGSTATNADGFLSGNWESVGATLGDNDKFFEGQINEDSSSGNEWGDDDDKIGLLLKLNVLGSDSSTNLQVVTNSTASAAGTGLGARSVRVGTDPTGSFVAAGSFFLLGADVDIVAANTEPIVAVTDPDGSGDTANTSFDIRYDLNDGDDTLSGNLQAAFYVYPSNNLRSVQDIRIFGVLIADQNDVSANNAAGTDDLTEGTNQLYTWDDPPAALQSSALFASILKVRSGSYYVYLVADDGKNPPAFAVSPGVITLQHAPLVQQLDPIIAETVDTGIRTGLQSNPYALDFTVVDYDSEARLQLFYAAASGISSVSATGTFPTQSFVLGKSLSGTRATPITATTSLTSRDSEFSWDVSNPLVSEGAYFLYAVATDSLNTTVGESALPLTVKHSPSFVFYEPALDTQRRIDSGSQPHYTVQWQKGPGDQDLDDNATISLYFTTDDPAVTDHATDSGASTTSLTGDADTKLIVSGLTEDGDGSSDMYVWNLRDPPNNVPQAGQQVWIYAVVTDGTNTTVARGGSLVLTHTPHILLKTRMPDIFQGDLVRLEWDDYMVDDASSTDDAYIRLYASRVSGRTTLQSLEENIQGSGGTDDTFVINSSDGTASGTLTAIRESSSNGFVWDTLTNAFTLPQGSYFIYAGINGDATFSDNTTAPLSQSSNELVIKANNGTNPNLQLSPSKALASVGDTLTFEVVVQSGGAAAELISVVLDVGSGLFTVVNSTSPFTDLGEVFSGGSVVEDTTIATQIRYSKSKAGGETVGAVGAPARLASFQLVVLSGLTGLHTMGFDGVETAMTIVGSSVPLKKSTGMSVQEAKVEALARGRLFASVRLEGRAPPVGNGDHATLLDVHLRLPGSTVDIGDATYKASNDAAPATPDTVEVQTNSGGDLALVDIPAGRYVLTVKDTSHLSGRTDTLVIRNGEAVNLSSAQGFFASDIRGDPSFLLDQDGSQLAAGDVTQDNEIDEDDINVIDAAWGTDNSKPLFKQADLNNDERVGVDDLTVTASNISNSTGFGAPPVFKRAAGDNQDAGVEVLAPGFVGQWRRGEEVEWVVLAHDLADLAGYGLVISYDPEELELLGAARRIKAGAVFNGNKRGYSHHIEYRPGHIEVAAARRGKRWFAHGDGELLRFRVRLAADGFPASLQVEEGKLVSSAYEKTPIRLMNNPASLALPRSFTLGQNFPNPFNPNTTIPFRVPLLDRLLAPVTVGVYNVTGQQVRVLMREAKAPGSYKVEWDGRNSTGKSVAGGVYFYKVQVGEETQVGKMALVK